MSPNEFLTDFWGFQDGKACLKYRPDLDDARVSRPQAWLSVKAR